ncbi:MAG: hypothetical protein GIX03_03485 [Candidatus Eremiobacteraeota bacterium]|nr:hypothetical protein [Candidatus Eremiobacteraeota bacterium]MBC5802076.1 hypothetical protein [Candidatus Eremiobacteraeota bacterium]MBC5821188.1 hypothetical protein [Candidatus Eremiobacteraeota bacterium]
MLAGLKSLLERTQLRVFIKLAHETRARNSSSSGALAVAVAEARSTIATFDRLANVIAAVKRWVIVAAAVSTAIALAIAIVGWSIGGALFVAVP